MRAAVLLLDTRWPEPATLSVCSLPITEPAHIIPPMKQLICNIDKVAREINIFSIFHLLCCSFFFMQWMSSPEKRKKKRHFQIKLNKERFFFKQKYIKNKQIMKNECFSFLDYINCLLKPAWKEKINFYCNCCTYTIRM